MQSVVECAVSDWFVRQQGPDAHETRGKTAQQRLRRLDQFLQAFDPRLLARADSCVVDLGYGRVPLTTIEWFQRLQTNYPTVRMIGIERETERVSAAQAMLTPDLAACGLTFRKGGFRLPLTPDEPVMLCRAMNVLRQYEEDAAVKAHAQIVAQLAEGGLLAEGTCDPLGRVMAVVLLRNRDGRPVMEGLLFAGSLKDPVLPRAFKAVLPKHLIHRVVQGNPIHGFFEAWDTAVRATRGQAEFGHRQHFVAAAERLAGTVVGIDTRRAWLRNGWMLWRGAPYP